MAAKVLKFRVTRERVAYGRYSVLFVSSFGDYSLRSDMCSTDFEAETGIHLPLGASKVFTMTPRASAAKKKKKKVAW